MKIPDVLVLNKSYTPVHVVEWKKAMSLIYQEHANAMDRAYTVYRSFNEWLKFSCECENFPEPFPKISTVNRVIAIPEIIVLTRYEKLPFRDVKYSRQTLFQRDNFTCCYCNKEFDKKQLTVDHIVPRTKGGKTTWDNTVTACKKCNSIKDYHSVAEIGFKMHFKPKKPKWISPIAKISKDHPCKSWKLFLNRTLVDTGD